MPGHLLLEGLAPLELPHTLGAPSCVEGGGRKPRFGKEYEVRIAGETGGRLG